MEIDGHVMSSRNVYLVGEERKQTLALYQSLKIVERLYRAGERGAGRF
jgi:pantoate--beta-alanine ligase